MTQNLQTSLFSLQTKLVLAMTGLILLGVLATGAVFVLRTKQERRQQAIEKVAATAPYFYQSLLVSPPADAAGNTAFAVKIHDVAPNFDRLALARDVRVLIVGDQGTVLHDTAGGLLGSTLAYPALQPEDIKRGFMTWQGAVPGDKLTFIASAGGPFSAGSVAIVPGAPGVSGGPQLDLPAIAGSVTAVPPPLGAASAEPAATGSLSQAFALSTFGPRPGFGVVLAVDSRKIEDAWLSALPGVGIAGALAMPFAVLAAIVLARQIARPVRELTLASEAMARGDFDQRVEVERDDEVGRLAKAFSSMAERVGQRDMQMRALVANVSHDLKTPMTSILGYAQAVKDGVVATEDIARVAGIIQTQAEQTSLLLNDLLFLSEVDAGQVLRAPQEIKVAELVQRAVDRVALQAEQRNVTLSMTGGGLRHVSVDMERTVRALANVIENAVKFSSEGATVRITAVETSGKLRIDVENDGLRIAEEELPRLFDRFYRGSGPQSGHGLGLAIARETIEMNNGRIEIANTVTGVRASILLPLSV